MRVPRWFHRPTTARVGGGAFHAVESPAAGWVGHIEDDGLPFERRAAAANLALRDDPGCIEAHAFLAAHAEDPDLARLHLVKALRTGQAFWEPVARERPDFAWWSVAATRHYMRALKQLGDLLAGLGDAHTAGICYRKLLEMNPRDNQGSGPSSGGHLERSRRRPPKARGCRRPGDAGGGRRGWRVQAAPGPAMAAVQITGGLFR